MVYEMKSLIMNASKKILYYITKPVSRSIQINFSLTYKRIMLSSFNKPTNSLKNS
ncbi:hypothetical protein N879_13510 [Alcaligenes sp. EGD-AK7]|nr:hypothetical protein N879_13510 [Alcaligenes sp. EGD-AK7]